jgi:short-subunit dehydrogenase
MMIRDVAGRVVAVTGGARGIGRSIAEELVARGARVAIGDVDADLARRTALEVGGGTTAHPLDVTDPASFERFLDEATAVHDGLDVLVNNAGIMPIGPFLDEDVELTRRTVEIDLVGVLTGTRLAGARFVARGHGHVVNVASVMGTLASPNAATYVATKHAVVGFSEALRQEWRGTGVEVTAICPGFVRTELIAGMSAPGALERFLVVDPEQVAALVVREIGRGRSRTVYTPRTIGGLSRLARTMPTGVRDWAFRATGGTAVTTGLDRDARAAYQARAAGTTDPAEAVR